MSTVDVLTAQGAVVRIRPVTPADTDPLLALHERASDRSRYLRFFSGAPSLPGEVERLVRAADGKHLALLAEDGGRAIGVASYEVTDADHAEFAVLVDDARQGEGVGTLLLEQLAAEARRHGITELVGEVLPTNSMMLRVSRDLAPDTPRTMDHEYGVARVTVPTTPDAAALAAVCARDRTAAHHSLRPLLAPRSVAVVGAGRQPGGIGHEVLRALLAGGFTGPVYPVNPRAERIAGLPAYPSVAAVADPVDLAVIAVPAGQVRDVVAECAASGVGGAVILTAGLAETGGEGAAAQAEIVRLARAHGLRLVGPNCLGVVNTDPAVRLSATFAPSLPPAGGLAIASQSGAVGVAILESAARTGTGVSSFVSLGNKADISGNDLLAYWYDDPATKAVALYLESFGNPRRFAWTARALARRKPVLAVKSGRSSGGRRAGLSHTAAAAAPDVAVDTLFAQAGVIRTDTLGELLDAARMLTDQPLPGGNRLAVIGNAGGLNILAADAAEAAGLTVPELSAGVRQRLHAAAPTAAGTGNPVDLGAEATPAALATSIAALAASGEVDAVVASFVATRSNDITGALAALAAAIDDAAELPVAVAVVGASQPPTVIGSRRAPVFPLPEEAVRALGHAARYAAWRREPLGHRPQLSDVDAHRARSIVDAALAAGGGWQDAETARDLLGCYGIPVVRTTMARSADEAVAAAAATGYPVVVKAAAPDLVHKSDLGAVWLNLPDAAAVRDAYTAVGLALRQPAPDVVVQTMADAGAELVAGVVHDRLFGSLVMLGLGGVHTDLLGDRAFRLLPVTDADAAAMWRSLRGAPLLTGYRGVAPADTAALEDLLLRVGRLAEDLPEVAELDLNPVLASARGVLAVDVKLRLSPADGEPDTYVRALSPASAGTTP
ncbi:bifunctional acetate--CoA ligase family protein/GNAT family N-acetyltransferase [Virgisporangium ochraceum]|uniref:GNAT family N-acetyltransferase n=1 Tax=Virgisporangium ochraceum TaxID=65505 RepID=A0A8J3ZZS3_9ACTN|nr:bifunctional GNAT family N-acetyltransferase/acetate--CoA ligase family protein [Virgisporangium ochraceum]GIJ71505.1 GNAT family N-acetyltransferase [Virgisporangium ochraceum]